MRSRTLLSRLTGISTPIGGVNWEPPRDQADASRRLLTYLSDRRTLYVPYELEVGPHVVQSVLKMRERIVSDLEDFPADSVIGEALTAMGAACRKFLTDFDEGRSPWRYEGDLWRYLGGLRALVGVHIARICCAYDIQCLTSWKACSRLTPMPTTQR